EAESTKDALANPEEARAKETAARAIEADLHEEESAVVDNIVDDKLRDFADEPVADHETNGVKENYDIYDVMVPEVVDEAPITRFPTSKPVEAIAEIQSPTAETLPEADEMLSEVAVEEIESLLRNVAVPAEIVQECVPEKEQSADVPDTLDTAARADESVEGN